MWELDSRLINQQSLPQVRIPLPHWYTPPRAKAFSNTRIVLVLADHYHKPSTLILLVKKIERETPERLNKNETRAEPTQWNDVTLFVQQVY